MRMTFNSSHSGFPDSHAKDPCANLEPVLEELRLFLGDLRSDYGFGYVRITCNFSRAEFTLDTLQHLCDWLHDKKVKLHALDLTCNNIACSDWSQLEPLLKLREQARWISLGGICLPRLDLANNGLKLFLDNKTASLTLYGAQSFGFPVPSVWKRTATRFSQEACGVPKR